MKRLHVLLVLLGLLVTVIIGGGVWVEYTEWKWRQETREEIERNSRETDFAIEASRYDPARGER